MAFRVRNAQQILGLTEMTTMAIVVSQSKNTLFPKNGFSASAWSFGRDIDFPDSVLSNGDSQLMLRNVTENEELARRAQMRLDASKAFHNFGALISGSPRLLVLSTRQATVPYCAWSSASCSARV